MTRKINSIQRTAAFTWYTGNQSPMIATGTVASALDETFSNSSQLEIYKLALGSEYSELEPCSSLSSDSKFNTMVWAEATAEKPYGIIASGMENGKLELWDPSTILDGKNATDALISRNLKHTGILRALDFNLFQPNLLASAGSNSEIYIWDLNNPSTPYTPGARSAKMDDITTVAWNHQVQHIVSTASKNGYTVVWDLRNKKEIMTLATGQTVMTGGRGSISSIAWHPNVATQIVTASDDDQNPVISLWDLRHAHSPEKILAGHSKGVLDLSWCRQDSDLLLSSGKDCKTLCWNPNTGKLNGEIYSNTNWTFSVGWCSQNPSLLASSSFDGSVNVFSIQGFQNNTSHNQSPLKGDSLQTNLTTNFELKSPPKWLRRPVGASFGFSGKLVSFNNALGRNETSTSAEDTKSTARYVKITTIETDPEIVKRAEQLEFATTSNASTLIEDRILTSCEDKEDWKILQTLFADNAREQLITYLGFDKDQVAASAATLLQKVKKPSFEPLPAKEKESLSTLTDSAFFLFGETSEETSDELFFGQIASGDPERTDTEHVQAHSGNHVPFSLYPKGSNEIDQLITRALILGDFESAVNACLLAERYSDALMLAICGGSDLLAHAQKTYISAKSKEYAYLYLLEGIIEEDLSSLIKNVDLKEWDSMLAILCTFAHSNDFGPSCDLMGDRLLKDSKMKQKALVFYLASGNLEKVSAIWISQFEKHENLRDNSSYAIQLQEFVEKVAIFCKAIDYDDHRTFNESGEYVLAGLYDKYCEYSETMAAQGKLDVALKYINMTPTGYIPVKPKLNPGSIVRDRVFHANSLNSRIKPEAPIFPFENKQLKSKKEAQLYTADVDHYTQDSNTSTTYQPSLPESSTLSNINYNVPMVTAPQHLQYQSRQSHIMESSGLHDTYQHYDQYDSTRQTVNLSSGNTTANSLSTKRASSFAEPPVPSQPVRGLVGPPSSSTTIGGYYSARQQPPQFQTQQQPLPPPPMNGVPPLPRNQRSDLPKHLK